MQRPRFGFFAILPLSDVDGALPSLLAFAKLSHVLFGRDWPYAPPIAVGYFTGQLDAYAALDADGHAAIDRGNAEAPFARFASTTEQELA